MSAPELTPWFNGMAVKPQRKGAYERDYGPYVRARPYKPVPLLDWWDGKQWLYLGDCGIGGYCVRQHQPWRGLAHPPEKA